MAFKQSFELLALDEISHMADTRKEKEWRFVQLLCAKVESGVDLIYTFEKHGELRNYKVRNLQPGDVVPSITNRYLEAFVFENEAHDLFGVDIRDIAIDFHGHFYALSQKTPMTVISPAQKAAREKAAKVAAAKAAKEKKAAGAADAELEAKLADMDPEKAAKVRAAMEAKAKKQADAELEAKLADMDPEKAAKVRAAMEAKAKKVRAAAEGEGK